MSRLITHEIGSLIKPNWRVKAVQGKRLSKTDIQYAETWGKKLKVPNYQELIELLSADSFSEDAKVRVKQWASQYAMKLLESAGLDVVYDGEQQRSEMYHYPVSHSSGFEFRGNVRSFDNKYYIKAACVAVPKLLKPYHLEEFVFLSQHAQKPLKVPITGAYTLVDWSFDEYYAKEAHEIGSKAGRRKRQEARRQFVLDVARNLIRPNIEALVKAGATWVQIDEPAVTTHPEEVPLFVESFNESVRGFDSQFSVHICFSDYNLIFPHIEGLEGCSQLSIGFANYDTRELGVRRAVRPGFETLYKFKALMKGASKRFRIGLGVLDIHTDFIEPPELVRDRILYGAEVLGDPELVSPCPDCGLRTRTWEVAYEKLKNLVEGTRMAEEILF